MKNLLLLSLLFFLAFTGCKDKKKAVPTKAHSEAAKKTVIKKDSLISDTVVNAQEIEEVQPKVTIKNKYFLICGSFQKKSNAEKFRNELEEQGYDSEVIERASGKNNDFFKVSYKGFSDRDEAFNTLAREKKQPNNENIWLLIK